MPLIIADTSGKTVSMSTLLEATVFSVWLLMQGDTCGRWFQSADTGVCPYNVHRNPVWAIVRT